MFANLNNFSADYRKFKKSAEKIDMHPYWQLTIPAATKYERRIMLKKIIKAEIGNTLVLVGEKREAIMLASWLSETGVKSYPLYGSLSIQDRNYITKCFNEGIINVIVSTNVKHIEKLKTYVVVHFEETIFSVKNKNNVFFEA